MRRQGTRGTASDSKHGIYTKKKARYGRACLKSAAYEPRNDEGKQVSQSWKRQDVLNKLAKDKLRIAIGQTECIGYTAHNHVDEWAETAAEKRSAMSVIPSGRKQDGAG